MLAADFIQKGFNRFQDIPFENIQFWLDTSALSFVPASLWGVHRDHGICLVTAHFLEIEWFQTSLTAAASVTLAKGETSGLSQYQDDFELTTWGRRYKFLRDGLLKGTISAIADNEWNGTTNFGIGFPI